MATRSVYEVSFARPCLASILYFKLNSILEAVFRSNRGTKKVYDIDDAEKTGLNKNRQCLQGGYRGGVMGS